MKRDTGRRHKHLKYWSLRLPTYFSSDKRGYVYEHVYFFQEKNRLCMLKWGNIHHVDGNRENNMPWNLQGMTKAQHMALHCVMRKIDQSGRKCSDPKCKTPYETRIRENGDPNWFGNKIDGWLCHRCYNRQRYYRIKKHKHEKVNLILYLKY